MTVDGTIYCSGVCCVSNDGSNSAGLPYKVGLLGTNESASSAKLHKYEVKMIDKHYYLNVYKSLESGSAVLIGVDVIQIQAVLINRDFLEPISQMLAVHLRLPTVQLDRISEMSSSGRSATASSSISPSKTGKDNLSGWGSHSNRLHRGDVNRDDVNNLDPREYTIQLTRSHEKGKNATASGPLPPWTSGAGSEFALSMFVPVAEEDAVAWSDARFSRPAFFVTVLAKGVSALSNDMEEVACQSPPWEAITKQIDHSVGLSSSNAAGKQPTPKGLGSLSSVTTDFSFEKKTSNLSVLSQSNNTNVNNKKGVGTGHRMVGNLLIKVC